MNVGAISAGSLSRIALRASDLTPTQRAWQNLQTTRAVGDPTGARSAYEAMPQPNLNRARTTGVTTSLRLSRNIYTFGSALMAGDLNSAQNALAKVQNDSKDSPSSALTNALQAESLEVQLVDGFLSTLYPISSSSISDASNAILQRHYTEGSALNLFV